jgi:hypothetical protein
VPNATPSPSADATVPTGIAFELHEAPLARDECIDPGALVWRPAAPRKSSPALCIGESAGMTWARVLPRDQPEPFEIVSARRPGALGLQVVRNRFSALLAVRSLRDDVFINGLPGLRLSILGVQDTILLAQPRRLLYVTEYFRPYVGPPPNDLVRDKRCPHCRDPFLPDTRVVSCYCGDFFHWETAESHPHLAEEDRLDCAERARICKRCQHELTTHGYRVWDPVSL